MGDSSIELGALPLESVIGFAGSVPQGLMLHKDDQRLVYPLGATIVIKDLIHNTQRFLLKDGHDHNVSCVTMSKSGKYVASGQETYSGFEAVAILWDFETGDVIHKMSLHKGKIQAVAISPSEKYLATLGGESDNKIVIWDIETGEAICGSPASNETTLTVKFFNNQDDMFVTAGRYNCRVWSFDRANRKMIPSETRLGALKRVITTLLVDPDDKFIYAGTTSGDLLRINVSANMLAEKGPAKKPFSLGITSVIQVTNGDLVVGAGDGTVAYLSSKGLRIIRKTEFEGGITSLMLNKAGDHFFVGTNKSNTFLVHLDTFDNELRSTCHYGRITDVCFPEGYSELFVTASSSDIRVWNARKCTELLRIKVPNLECHSIALTKDGKAIISGWEDGKVRAFRPQSGTLIYSINDAHSGAVTAVRPSSDGSKVVTGGEDGRVRVWWISGNTQKMMASFKEHKGPVSSIRIKSDDAECISASHDGTCIVWDIERYTRVNALFASTQFSTVLYHPDESQFLTTGSDRKVTYWDAVECSAIRIVDGSESGAINSLDISSDGETFVSGSTDRIVKLWAYDQGIAYFYGIGHSGSIKRVAMSPDKSFIVSVGEEGAIFLWKMQNMSFATKPQGEPSGTTEALIEGDASQLADRA